MPTYTYQCGECTHRFDAVQSIHDNALDTCPNCSGPLRKVFGTVGVTFKGSGFYRTDSRAASKSSTSSSSSSTSASKPAASGSSASGSSSGAAAS